MNQTSRIPHAMPSTPDGLLEAVLYHPERRNELRTLLSRALNTWEFPPAWAVTLSDQLEAVDSLPPNPPMAQCTAAFMRTARARVPLQGVGGVVPDGAKVEVRWERCFRKLHEGSPSTRLVHVYMVRYTDASGKVVSAESVPDFLLYDLKHEEVGQKNLKIS